VRNTGSALWELVGTLVLAVIAGVILCVTVGPNPDPPRPAPCWPTEPEQRTREEALRVIYLAWKAAGGENRDTPPPRAADLEEREVTVFDEHGKPYQLTFSWANIQERFRFITYVDYGEGSQYPPDPADRVIAEVPFGEPPIHLVLFGDGDIVPLHKTSEGYAALPRSN
jgi:hypothetical protein